MLLAREFTIANADAPYSPPPSKLLDRIPQALCAHYYNRRTEPAFAIMGKKTSIRILCGSIKLLLFP